MSALGGPAAPGGAAAKRRTSTTQSKRDTSSPRSSPSPARRRPGKEARGSASEPEESGRPSVAGDDLRAFEEYKLKKTQKKMAAAVVEPPLVQSQPQAQPSRNRAELAPLGSQPNTDPYKRNRTGGNRTTSDAEFLGSRRGLETGTLTQSSNQGTIVRHGALEGGLQSDAPMTLGPNSTVGAGGVRATAREASQANVLMQAEYGQGLTIGQHHSQYRGTPVRGPAGAAVAGSAPIQETGVLTQHLNAISHVPVTRIAGRPQLDSRVPERTELAVDPDGEVAPDAVPHGRKMWDPDNPALAPFVAGYNHGHEAALLTRGGAGNAAILPNEPDIDYGNESPRYCCLHDSIDPRPLSDERALLAKIGPFHLWELSPAWRVPLLTCEDVQCCLWSLFCPCCSAMYMRSKILEGHHERYLCCQGLASKGLDNIVCGCPVTCMTLESFLCCPCAVGANRAFYSQQHRIRRDPWDNRVRRCNNIVHYGYCCSGTPTNEEDKDEMNRRISSSGNPLNCLALLCYLPLLPFMTVQLFLQIRDGPRKNPYEPPKPAQKRPPARLPPSKIHAEDEAEMKRTGRSMRKKRAKLNALGEELHELDANGNPCEPKMLWWGDEEVDTDTDVQTYIDAAAARRINGGDVSQKRRRRRLKHMLITKQPRKNRIHPLHPLAPHVGDPDEQQKVRSCPTPQKDPEADVREVHSLWSTTMIERAVWAWGEPSDAEDEDVTVAEQLLNQSGGRSPNKRLNKTSSRPSSRSGQDRPAHSEDRGNQPHDVEDYEMMKTLARAKRHGERLLAGEDEAQSSKVEESLNHLEGSSYSLGRRRKSGRPDHRERHVETTSWEHVERDPGGSAVLGATGATVDSDDSVDFANMSHNMPTPWFDSDDSGSEKRGSRSKKRHPRTRRVRRDGAGIGVKAQSSLEEPGTRSLTRLSVASTPSPPKPPQDPGPAPLQQATSLNDDVPPWQSKTLTGESRIGDGGRTWSAGDGNPERKRQPRQRQSHPPSSTMTGTPYKRRERHNLTAEGKQAILKNSLGSFRQATIPTVANADTLAVQSRAVVRGGSAKRDDPPIWKEYHAI